MIQKLKRIPLQCLLVLSLTKVAFGAALQSCDSKIDTTSGCSPLSLDNSGYCIDGTSKKIYSLTKGTGSTADSCAEYSAASKNYLFTTTNTLGVMSSDSSGILYICNASKVCTQVTDGYFLTDDGGLATPATSTLYLFKCVSGTCTKTTTDGYYPVNSSIDSTNKLYYCKSSTCSGEVNPPDGYYINGESTTNLYKCTNKSCGLDDPKKDGYYLSGEGYDTNKYINIIQCTFSSNACTYSTVTAPTRAATYYYVNGDDESSIIKCISSGSAFTSCEKIETVVTEPLTGYLNNDKQTVIICNEDEDSSTTICKKATDPAQGKIKYYIDVSSSLSKIIKCDNQSGTVACENTSITPSKDKAMAYLGDGENMVIQCIDDGNGNTVCGATGPTEEKKKVNYINAASTGEIIDCESGKACTTNMATETTTGVAYPDYVNDGYVIKCVSSACSSTQSEADAEDTDNNKHAQSCNYIDGYDSKGETLLSCTKDGTDITCDEIPLENFPDGHAVLDCSQATAFSTVIALDGTNKQLILIASASLKAASAGFAYIDANDSSLKSVIQCSTTCETVDSGVSAATDGGMDVNAFFIDGTDTTSKKIIACTDKKGCESITGVKESETSYYVDSINKENRIGCTSGNSGTCSTTSISADSYYVDGYNAENVLNCKTTAICVEEKGNSTPGYGYIDAGTAGNIIVCKNGTGENATVVCKSQANGFSSINSVDQITAFIDATASDKITLIKCPAAGTTCTSSQLTSFDDGVAYLDGSSLATVSGSDKITNVIVCKKEGDSGVCSALSASNTEPKTESGYVYIDGFSTNKANVIQCSKEDSNITCTSITGPTTSDKEYGFIDATDNGTPVTKIIKCDSGCASKSNTAKAEEGKAPANQYLINFSDKTKIIVCTAAAGCSSISGNTETEINKFYPDEYTKANILYCEKPAASSKTTNTKSATVQAKECTPTTHAGASKTAYYINGYEDKYILECDATNGCVSSLNRAIEDQPSHYVDAEGDSGSKPVIITCTTEHCTSGPGVYTDGAAYLDPVDPKNVIICTKTSKCADPVAGVIASTSDTYIDAGNEAQIIYCTATACNYFKSKPSDGTSEYYARFSTDVKEIIECDYNSTATNKSTCKLDKKTAIAKNSVYKNYLFGKENGDATNPLIICGANGCKPSTAKITNNKKSYYINSDVQSVDRKLNGDIIECTEASKECKILAGSDTDVYLNANYDASANKKEVIICRSGEGCLEQKTNSTATDFRYYVNAGSTFKKALNDTLIECKDTCQVLTTVKDGEIYINEFDTSQTIQCYEEKGCTAIKSQATDKKNEIFLNSSNLNKSKGTEPTGNEPLKNDLIKCVYEEGNITCSAKDGQADEVYVNSHNTTEIIYCKSDGCTTKASEALTTQPEYYINADPTDEEKLDGDLIKCKNTGTKITCEVTKGGDGDVYLNANVENDSNNKPLIICTKENGCLTDTSKATSAESLPAYYVNSGSVLTAKLNDTLIECNFGTATADCDIKQAVANDVYRNYGNNTETHQLIKCTTNGCKVAISSATEKSNEYYLNAGDKDEKALDYDIIECSNDGESVECVELQETGEGVYINSNYSENGDSNQLILCSSDNGCEGIKTSAKGNEYYVNAEANDLNNAIIFCSNKKCEKQTPIDIPTYYVGTTQEGEVNGLIECTKSEVVVDATTTTTTTTTTPAASRRKRATEEKCKLKSAFTSNGYFLNAGYNKSVNQTIICDSTDGCETQNVDLGYYVNAGDDTKPIIKCDKEGSECYSEESDSCPQTSDAIAGNYCYEEGLLKFFPEGNSTAIAASKSDDIYTFATIPSGGFPGIKSETGALFKISRYFINRFYQSGIVMIDKNGKLVDNLSSADQSEVSLYDCNDSTKTCTLRAGCTSNTYMYDSENKKAVFCNSGKLEYAEFTGYVVDGNRMVGTNHPYIIECQNNGNNCKSIKPKVSSYYENSGYDSSSNSLIECYSNNCVTKTADVGYYVGHEGEGIIQCTSSTSCNYSKSKSKVKYVNAGYNKSSSAIISCAKNSCSAVKAEIGYYLTYINTLLIYCSSPSNCVEFTPTVNYFENADSTESSSTIINCDQNSQVVTCVLEATGNGFYLSSSPNELILCKSGNKCKTVKVKNGIFSSAVKAPSTKGSRRFDDDGVELSEDGNSVTIPRDSDDSYNIIRCVQEKCSALSPSEVAAIPICEFNNNKCYITLEYAMTKSATTSITAGNICTNADRSIFYFATDTIVVKPNVISGVTATYVYTTTNSNCLEVNDSYSDMYFTVGSNIYLLDQGSVLQFYEQGYYFINTAKNSIVSGNDIDSYNDENVKLYKCNGSSCSIMDKPDSLTYYADVNKRIIRYNVNSDSYSFAYDKDITCIFANNKCTPNADLKNQEFCITYKGELALATADIKNRETGECYKASTISSNIYGYSQYLYSMNVYSAQMIDETGYYIISLSTNTTVVSKNYKTKNNNLVIYGCQLSSCKVIEPEEDTYYYDSNAKTILRYKDGVWKTPDTSGYAYISIDPSNTYIYRFTKNLEEVKINAMANYGYYYTVDGEMYHCDRDENGDCTPIDNTGYYFTNAGEVYYCVHDSEEIEPTECTKQACVSGQYYYIEDAYYRCESSSTLVPVMSRFCSYNDNVIVNFPIALTEEYPEKIKQAVEGIEKNNNSTAIVSRRGKNYLESVSGIFTNCTYNVEETKSTFDLVCVNNFVTVDEETDDIKICSMEQLGFVECIEDEENPEKCNISGASPLLKPVFLTVFAIIFSLLYYLL